MIDFHWLESSGNLKSADILFFYTCKISVQKDTVSVNGSKFLNKNNNLGLDKATLTNQIKSNHKGHKFLPTTKI